MSKKTNKEEYINIKNQKVNSSDRKDLLFLMYKEQYANIDRHVKLSWQSLGVVALSLTTMISIYKFQVPTFYATFLLIFFLIWVLVRMLDSLYWYEYSLHVISKIESLFLDIGDTEVQPFLNKKREIKIFKLEGYLEAWAIHSIGTTLIGFFALLYYFNTQTSLWHDILIIILVIVSVTILSLYAKHIFDSIKHLKEVKSS